MTESQTSNFESAKPIESTLIAVIFPPHSNSVAAMFGAPETIDLYYVDLLEGMNSANLRASYPSGMLSEAMILKAADKQISDDGFSRVAEWSKTEDEEPRTIARIVVESTLNL